MIRILGTIFAGLLGLAFGSFLNVCLTRWPEGESIVHPRSHCRHCTHTLSWWENIPLISWLTLRGRCRNCHTWISWRYPLVELAVAVLWAYSIWQSMPDILFPHMFTFYLYDSIVSVIEAMILSWLLVALAVLDAEQLWLPDQITLPGIVLGCLINLARLAMLSTFPLPIGVIGINREIGWAAAKYVLGIFAAAGLILLIRWLYWLIRHREGIGLGDAKLMALLAAWLGLPGALLAFALGIVLGALTALVLLAIPSARSGSERWSLTKLPLGTFLCIGGIISSLWGQPILAAYLHWSSL